MTLTKWKDCAGLHINLGIWKQLQIPTRRWITPTIQAVEDTRGVVEMSRDESWTYTLDEVAEILNGLMGECACNYNGIDEWLPQSCKYADTQCPRPKEKHGCWKQFLLQGAYVKGKDF